MNRRYDSLPAITADLANDLMKAISVNPTLSAKFGGSNVSCSAYVEVDM